MPHRPLLTEKHLNFEHESHGPDTFFVNELTVFCCIPLNINPMGWPIFLLLNVFQCLSHGPDCLLTLSIENTYPIACQPFRH